MRAHRTERYIAVLLPALTLLFIFTQSLLPPAVSGAESSRVAALLSAIFGETSALGSFLVTHVRKLAHFFEYGVLGMEMLWFARAFRDTLPDAVRRTVPLWGVTFGFIDETLQCFSSRGPSIADVWLDGAGYITLHGLLYLALCLVQRCRKASKGDK